MQVHTPTWAFRGLQDCGDAEFAPWCNAVPRSDARECWTSLFGDTLLPRLVASERDFFLGGEEGWLALMHAEHTDASQHCSCAANTAPPRSQASERA
jgi:hypothetical protein